VTRYTVIWVEDASDELAEIWMAAVDRHAVAAAANSIDAELAEDAEHKGGPLSEGLRVLAYPPLRVLFSVDAADRIVEVAWVQQV
jgi:plasmid stabilization system protein ParE